MSGRRVLLTGASGFIGRQTIAPLLDLSFEVHAVGNRVTDRRAIWHRADLLDQAGRRRLVAEVRPAALLHCAWFTRHGVFWDAPENIDWVAASLDLARAAAAQGTRRILMVGSCAEYDWATPQAHPWREDDPAHPSSFYGVAKDALHRLMAAFAAEAGLGLVWARLFHLYGPHEAPTRLVPQLLAALRAGRSAEIKSGNAVRDLMHVADAGRALAHLLGGEACGAINVASGQAVTLGALGGIAARLAGRPDLLKVGQHAGAEPLDMAADIARLRATGFTPSIALEDGMAALWSPTPRSDLPAAPPDYEQAARLYRAAKYQEARAAVEVLLAAVPDHPGGLNLLGVLHRHRGALADALACLERASALDPERETAWVNLGNVRLDLEAPEAAVAAYERALEAAPARTDTLRLLGNALARCGRDAEAMDRFATALARDGAAPTLLRDRARAQFTAGRLDAALADLDAAIELRGEDLEYPLMKAQMLRLSGRAKDAAALLRALLDRAPEDANVHLALADALLSVERREQANTHYRRAMALRPDDQHILGKLCWSLLNSRYGSEAEHIGEAVAIARRMVRHGVMHPSNAHAVQSALLRVADLNGLAAFDALFPDRRILLDYWVRRNALGALHAQLARVETMDDRLELMDCHAAWGQRYEAKPVPLRPRRAPMGPKIRVGFVSSDLRHHPVSYFALPIFEHYDRDRFDLFAYSFHPGAPDDVQRDIAGRIAGFRRMPNLPEQDIARRIADDRLDILFELGGSTHLNRLEVMAYQPAPVQVSWLGYPHSSGLSRIGHILVDPYLRPPDPRLLLERPFEMPSSWVSLGRLGFIDHPIRPGLPEERTGQITFGTMNNPYKYAPAAIALWARVLTELPGSRFLMVRPEAGVPAFRDNMARAFARHGIAADRLDYVAVRGRHMAHYNDMDIALDTLPQTGGTTTCEALWMGVPTISLVGPAFFERLSYSNLSNAGLGALAVDTPDAYVASAVGLAADAAWRRALRQDLRATIRRSPLGDAPGWVRDFERLIRHTLEHADAPEPILAA